MKIAHPSNNVGNAASRQGTGREDRQPPAAAIYPLWISNHMTLRIELCQIEPFCSAALAEGTLSLAPSAEQADDREVLVDLADCQTIRSDQLNKLIALNGHLRSKGRTLVLAQQVAASSRS